MSNSYHNIQGSPQISSRDIGYVLRILGQNPTEDEIVEMVMKVKILLDVTTLVTRMNVIIITHQHHHRRTMMMMMMLMLMMMTMTMTMMTMMMMMSCLFANEWLILWNDLADVTARLLHPLC